MTEAYQFKIKEKRELRQLGSFDSEVDLMLERMEKVKPFKEKELIICAMGSTRLVCPFDCETWAVNMGYMQIMEMDGHFTKIFLTHTQVKDVRGYGAFCWDQFNKFAEKGITVYNIHKVKGLNSKMYPYKTIMKRFPRCNDFFSNTISYMLALAIHQGYTKIRMYGCDMMTQSEYAWEKGGMEYWIGVAHGLGIDTWIAEGSSLMKTITGKPYGVKYFNMKDIDPTGAMRRAVKKMVPKSNSTCYMFENPIRPPDPSITPFVEVSLGNGNTTSPFKES